MPFFVNFRLDSILVPAESTGVVDQFAGASSSVSSHFGPKRTR